jgi:hypothetical protein
MNDNRSEGEICWNYTMAIVLHNTKDVSTIKQKLINHIEHNYYIQAISQTESTIWINY